MRNPDNGWIQLSTAELFLLWSAADLGEPPAELAIEHLGRTPAQRAMLVEQADAALASRDLGTVHRPDPELANLLSMLAGAQRRVSLWADGPGQQFRGVIGLYPHANAGIALVDGMAQVGLVRRGEVIAVLTDALDPIPGAPGHSANVTWSDYQVACGQGNLAGADGFLRSLRSAGVRLPETHTLLRVTTDGYGGGALTVHGRDGSHAELSWVDTEHGRYALRHNGDWLTVTPADPARLVGLMNEVMAA